MLSRIKVGSRTDLFDIALILGCRNRPNVWRRYV
jgi:hypothetical protein